MKRYRAAYAVAGFSATAAVIFLVVRQGASWWPPVVFAVLPDISFLLGMSGDLARGQLHPRAVPLYNALHRYWAPGALVAVTLLLRSPDWLAAGLAWTAHISFDRSLGFGLRTPEGFQRT
jgi:hypothetical protein